VHWQHKATATSEVFYVLRGDGDGKTGQIVVSTWAAWKIYMLWEGFWFGLNIPKTHE